MCALGIFASATVAHAQYIGTNFVTGNNDGAVANGNNHASGTNAIAFGFTQGTAVGNGAQALNDFTSAFGFNANALGLAGTAIGNLAQADGDGSTVVGSGSTAFGLTSSVFGSAALANGLGATALGSSSQAIDDGATAVGFGAQATALSSAAFGSGAQALQSGATAVGTLSFADGEAATAIGGTAGATAFGASSFGAGALADNLRATAIGTESLASGEFSTAIGTNASAAGNGATALGTGANAAFEGSTALGALATTTRNNQIAIGTSDNTYTAAGITSAASRAAQTGPVLIVTSDNSGNLAAATPDEIVTGSAAFQGLANSVEKNTEGVAMALAMAGTGAILPVDKNYAVSVNVGTFEGEGAMAMGGVARLSDSIFASGGLGLGTNEGTTGGRAGVTFAW